MSKTDSITAYLAAARALDQRMEDSRRRLGRAELAGDTAAIDGERSLQDHILGQQEALARHMEAI
jgi:hypothetical protein